MSLRIAPLAVFAAASAVTCAWAQSPQALIAEADRDYAAKRYAQAATTYLRVFELDPAEPSFAYNAACCQALLGRADAAFQSLERAVAAGFANADGAARDTDLAPLRTDARWDGLLARMRDRGLRERAFWDSSAMATGYRETLSEDERIAGLSRFWSEVKFNFVDTDRLDALDWDGLYLRYLPKVRSTTSTAAYYRLLAGLCAQLKDGHTNVYPAPEIREAHSAQPLLRTRLVEGRVLVTQVEDAALKARGVKPGVEVVTVDGQPVKAYAESALAPFQSASTPQDLETRTYTYAFLAGPLGETPKVGFRDESGRAFELPVPRVAGAIRRKAMPLEPPFSFRMLPGDVALVTLGTFGTSEAADQFMEAFPGISKAKALILDVRANGGGNSSVGYRILATLAKEPFFGTTWATRDYKPAFRAWERPRQVYRQSPSPMPPDGARHFPGPVAVLTSPATYSAAEDFSVAFVAMKRGLVIGEPTGGSTGQPLFIRLPGGGSARICTKRDTFPDGKPFVGVGVQPDRLVQPRVEDFRQGRDTVLEAALGELTRQVGVRP
ncbi:S41 family peptidase [Geothrix sp.]|jgi:C-terminal processing protease CtpA/Prc|uniref:S41 family peptidase n=1 Tax=Geothrix sp. TaxID=1962974 RepID=UPI0025BDC36A|nr:S41 family peptidase [Geothrix sp.]